MTKVILQGDWIRIPTSLRPTEFFKYITEQIAKKVPEEHESNLYMWLEDFWEGVPAIRLQWHRPMTTEELKVFGD